MRGLPIAIGLAWLVAAAPATAIEPDPPQQLISDEEAIGIHARRLLQKPDRRLGRADRARHEALTHYYAERGSRPLWVKSDKLSLAAKSVIDEIGRANDWGLDAGAFDFSAAEFSGTPSTEVLARAEIAVSLAVLKYANHARGGRIPEPAKQLSSYLDRKPQLKDPSLVLDEVSKSGEPAVYLRNLHPQHPQFKALRKALLKLRGGGQDDEDAVVQLPATGPLLQLGRKHPDVALLRERLEVTASRSEDGDAIDVEVFDRDVLEAVKEFQRQAGLSIDGVVGNNTRATLNGDKAELSESTLIANMEQWRWMPDDLGEFYIQSNVPEYKVQVFKDGNEIHSERIIVGELDKQTPVFSDTLETVVFHPFWGVPNSIKVNEILPSVARGGSALRRHNLRLQYRGRDVNPETVDWSTADIRKFHVYQPPGGGNVLGKVKFLFPNHHQVYMHDTPTKHLFNKKQRTFSHGCMRVRNPLKLAEAVLSYDRGWDGAKVDATVRNGPENNNIKLSRKVPVHVTYFTAVADENGDVKAFRDFYGHEKRIKLALAGRWSEIRKGRDHLAPVKLKRPRIVSPQYSDPISDLFKQAFGF
ncbi:MAG: L,D-transpeptidase family protein [Alphaproteobacteria bacterium]|nr:L,D-transpeptidase family protein [Alphaproteobacteria bacterium]